ncbi:hypothetical protein GJ699_02600 [Duganella sp. FT80W]|uniref:Phage tail assembly protein n=1 Tax=Duganella guangzhouensis TaxID=2666084 RepID=A0A6I2KSX8_9BURK|nr:hypothetical protein [Duganella guangzhouensis]MRW88868.1 hypothetical protein [Duganella guangzhouensis]
MANASKVRVNTDVAATAAITKSAEVATIPAGDITITLKKPGVLAQYRIVEIVGGDAAKNQTYMGMVLPLLWIIAINETPTPPISTKRELEALITRLGEVGTDAVMGHVYGNPAEAELSEEAVKN